MSRTRVVAVPLTLSLYVGRRFLLAVMGMQAGLTAIGSLFDFLDLLRQASDKPRATFGRVVAMEILRVPWLGMQILPFAVLLGGIFAFWRLTRSSELVVARASGVSAWQFLAMPVACAALVGVFTTTVVSPLSAVMFARADTLYSMYLAVDSGPLSLTGGQLWLRQADPVAGPGGVAILHAHDVHLKGKALTTGHVSILQLNQHTSLFNRIEAHTGVLQPGGWTLDQVSILKPDKVTQVLPVMRFPTDLTVGRVQESFASPSALSFWALPRFINLLERSGFSPTRHELAFQSLLALPLLCATMALVAAGFSMRPARRGGAGRMLGAGLACGFALFMLSEVAAQFGKSGALPVVLAAWAPAGAGLMLALALLLHLEDG
ncbi:MAG: LPS export ABC transporter permease LptG [Acidiphilium sp.]|nr:LPS export ABC transporter permease LptG [Acidiphilium sp.]MDD4935225.1 LPS export ABC transporter permease LptG [Acidiphilium sp.]